MAVEDYLEAVDYGRTWAKGAYASDPRLVADTYIARGPCYAGFLDGKLLGVAGICLLWPGVGEAWAVPTEWGRRHGKHYHRAVRDGYRQIVTEQRLRRVHAWVDAEFWVGIRWAMALGFRVETPRLRGYGPQGQDFVLLSQFPSQKEPV